MEQHEGLPLFRVHLQVLTGGRQPFHWLDPAAVRAMRTMSGRRGLLGMNTLEAAKSDEVTVEWRIGGASPEQLESLVSLLTLCLHREPHSRPLLPDVQSTLQRIASSCSETSTSTPLSESLPKSVRQAY